MLCNCVVSKSSQCQIFIYQPPSPAEHLPPINYPRTWQKLFKKGKKIKLK